MTASTPESTAVAARLLGILGIAAAAFLFLSPLPMMRRIVREKNTLDFSAIPMLAQLVESSCWVLWSLAAGSLCWECVLVASFGVCGCVMQSLLQCAG